MGNRENVIVSTQEIERQKDFTALVQSIINNQSIKDGYKKRATVITYGCQQNQNDSEHIMGMLCEMGYEPWEDKQTADLIIFNTCAVREGAELRVFGNIGALVHNKNRNPDLKIGVCGCMMQVDDNIKKIKQKYRHVDMIFGTHTLYKLPEILYNSLSNGGRIFDIEQIDGQIIEELPIVRTSPYAANVSIMYGCNNFCAYCIVPYTRGRERSRLPKNIYQEIEDLAKSGVKDITLLGQNVNSYGQDLDIDIDFSDLLDNICKIEGDFRVRFMTSHPKDANLKLFKTMAKNEKIAKHLHLPVQAGDNHVLEAMNRGYTKEKYLNLIAQARELMPDLAVTSDIIVGFPGETYDEFLNTLDVVKKVEFDLLYTFIYSKRSGTPAQKMENQVPAGEKKKRLLELMALQNPISLIKNQQLLNKNIRVLVEGVSKTNEKMLSGRTQGNKIVNFEGNKELIGNFVDLLIIKAHTWSLYGKIINTEE